MSGDDALEAAARRLEQAVAQLEARLALRPRGEAEPAGLFDDDRARLAAELDASRARERDLQAAGAQASAALGRAIAEIRAALGETVSEDGDGESADQTSAGSSDWAGAGPPDEDLIQEG